MPANSSFVPVDRIFLDLKNPRHKPYSSQAEVISYLCQKEAVFALAQDVANFGLNPLELFALIPLGKKNGRAQNTFVVAEGNRRLCAIKLLHDPALAPANLRKDFKRLAESTSHPLSHVTAVVFQDATDVDPWLERIHGGPQGGIGRRSWDSDQKQRHFGDPKNMLAQKVLDYAERCGFISAIERKGRLTTAQRYLGNAIFREALGLESAAAEHIARNRPTEDFNAVLRGFARDLVENRKVTSRANSENIRDYARELSLTRGVSLTRIPAVSLAAAATVRKPRRVPTEPAKPKSVTYERDIANALKELGSYKLEKLYFSVCDLSLESHTLLISVGVWSFFETLTARCGRDPSTSFGSFLSKNRLSSLGFTDTRALTLALDRITAYGNTTKHHDTSANFNGEQVANDMDTLKDLIMGLISQAKP